MPRRTKQDVDPGKVGEREHGLGSPLYFGRALRATRIDRDRRQEEWGAAIGADASVISRAERGERPVPSRAELVRWIRAWRLPRQLGTHLLVAAGYLPPLPAAFSSNDQLYLDHALEELLGVASSDTASVEPVFTPLLQQRLQKLRRVATTTGNTGARNIPPWQAADTLVGAQSALKRVAQPLGTMRAEVIVHGREAIAQALIQLLASAAAPVDGRQIIINFHHEDPFATEPMLRKLWQRALQQALDQGWRIIQVTAEAPGPAQVGAFMELCAQPEQYRSLYFDSEDSANAVPDLLLVPSGGLLTIVAASKTDTPPTATFSPPEGSVVAMEQRLAMPLFRAKPHWVYHPATRADGLFPLASDAIAARDGGELAGAEDEYW